MMLPIKNILVLLVFMLQVNIAFPSQQSAIFQTDQTPRFKKITVKDGLSQNWIRCIYQDDFGYMWFGSSSGLNRYDGYDISIFPLGNVNINAIARKNENEIWICNDLGVFIYNHIEDSIYSFNYLKGQTVLCILQETEDHVWFGTNTGLYEYSILEDQLRSISLEQDELNDASSNYINTLYLDSKQNIWIGTKAGLSKYHNSKGTIINYYPTGKHGSLSGKDVMAICEDGNGRIWIGTAKDGVNLMLPDSNKVEFRRIIDGAIVGLMVDTKNTLWVGKSSNGGITQLDLNNFSLESKQQTKQILRNRVDPNSLSDNSIFCFYEDRYKDIWIGTFGGGVNYLSYRSKQFFSINSGSTAYPVISNDLVNAIYDDDQQLWIGTEGGLDLYNKTNNKSYHFNYNSSAPTSLSSDPVYSLLKDSKGNIWIGTWSGGINLYNNEQNSFKRFVPDNTPGSISSQNVFSIFEDSNNNLWIGTVGGGLNKYDYQTSTFQTFKHNDQDPSSLYYDIVHDINETQDGKLLIAAYGSLDILNPVSNTFSHYPLSNAFSNDKVSRYVTFIFVDSRKNIWLGTNNGLVLFDTNIANFKLYTSLNGLAGNTIQGIEEDNDGNLWISTNSGLSKFINAIHLPDSCNIINFFESDGLAANDFKRGAIFKNKAGQILLGTSHGITYFNPDNIYLNNIPPIIVLTEMQLLQQKSTKASEDYTIIKNINHKEVITLPYNKSDFLLTFSALNYLNTTSNNYKYQLQGYDPDWINSEGQRTATYKNLKPGEYIFKVIASNNDNLWNTEPKTLRIVISPPFWQTWLFKLAFIICFAGLIYLVFTLRFKAIQHEKRKLEKLVGKRTLELELANGKLEEQSEELLQQNTELKRNQKELSLHKDQLEELVIKRTTELEKAKNKAEDSERLKTVFLANISHEIRTPLNAITGFALLYENPNLNADKRNNYFKIIQSNTKQLLMLMDDILDLSSIETNQLKVNYSTFSPANICHEIHQQYQTNLTDSLQFKLNITANDFTIEINSDQNRFRQILSNLVSNAFKFTEQGLIEIGFYRDKYGSIIFYVKDSGKGIPPAEQPYIFEAFTKFESDTKFHSGAGLGLTLSKQLTELLGGQIWFDSQINVGSTFYFSLPIKPKA